MLVRDILVSAWESYNTSVHEAPPLSYAQLPTVPGAVKGFNISQPEHFKLEVDHIRGSKEAEFAVLLSFCKNIERIDAGFPGALYNQWVIHLFAKAIESPRMAATSSVFQRLKEVRLTTFSNDTSIDFSSVAHALQLPNLNSFECSSLNFPTDGVHPAMQSAVRRLRLSSLQFGPAQMEMLLSICQDVTSLELEWMSGDINFVYDYTLLGDVLRRRAQKPEYFAITPFACDDSMDDLPVTGTLGSLRSLTRLKTLTLPIDSLCDCESPEILSTSLRHLLPLSLQEITIWTEESERSAESIRDYLGTQLSDLVRDTQFDALTKIQLDELHDFKMDVTGLEWNVWMNELLWTIMEKKNSGSGAIE